MIKFYDLIVREVKKETDDTVSILFEVPETAREAFGFIPGQYVTIEHELNGEKLRRDYSICSSVQSGELRIAVKRVEGGRFSTFATTEVKAGMKLSVSTPTGKFILKPEAGQKKNYLAFASGSGITPVFSMLQSVLDIETESTFTLVYGNRSSEQTIFKAELDRLASEYKERFDLTYVFSRKMSENALPGRIDADKIDQLFAGRFSGKEFDKAYLCGPEAMIQTVEQKLLEKGFDENDIAFELFTPPAADSQETVSTDLSGTSEVVVILDDETETFRMDKKEYILTAALLNHLDAPYSCQGGICSSCLAKVTEGRAVMDKNSVLSEAEVKEGLILTCQAHPVTDKIVIDFDDV